MSKSTYKFEIRGVDKSAAAFASIKGRAAATGAQIQKMVGGAIAAAGAYLYFAAIKGGIDELGHLSDVAQKTNTSVSELTQTAAAMSALGIQRMGIDQLGKAFDYMAKTTGRTGLEGFYKTIDELGKIPDVAQRSQAAMKIFGDAGMEFVPLINGAKESTAALRTVIKAMPGVSQAAAEAGDAAADAMGFIVNDVKSIWLEGLGFIAKKLNNDYTGDVRTAALNAGNALKFYTKAAVATCISWVSKLQATYSSMGTLVGSVFGALYEKFFGSGGTWKSVWKTIVEGREQARQELWDDWEEIDETRQLRIMKANGEYQMRKHAIRGYAAAQGSAATSGTGGAANGNRGAANGADVSRQTRISNDLIMGGSNAATRLQILGPTLQNETKKQTSILEKIAQNTEKTASNTKEKKTDMKLGVIDE